MSSDINVEELNIQFQRFLKHNRKGLNAKDVKNALCALILNITESMKGYDIDMVCNEAVYQFGVAQPGIIAQDEFVNLIQFLTLEKGSELNHWA